MISLTVFFDAASQRHNDVILWPAIRRVSGNDFVFQQDSAPICRALYVQQLNCCVKKRKTFLGPTCGIQKAQICPVDYEIWAVMQHLVYHRRIHSVDELKQRLIDVWWGLEQSIFDEAIDQWRGRHRACVPATGGHFEISLWTNNVDFVHICYIQCVLLDCYIFNYEIMLATLANTFLFILQGSALADLRYGGRF